MSNVLDDTKKQQILALGRLGWTLRRIEAATDVRRETASAHLKAAGVPVRGRGGRPTVWPPAKPATTGAVATDPAPVTAPSQQVSTIIRNSLVLDLSKSPPGVRLLRTLGRRGGAE